MMKAATQVDPCLATNGEGVSFREFACMYPELDPYYFSFEKFYDPAGVLHWMQAHPMVPVIACLLYGVLIVSGQAYFETRPRWNWRFTMASWNLCLSLFSMMGLIRTLPQLIHNLTHLSFQDNLCADPRITYGSGSTGLWVQLFILSKFPELFDTFFIVIHKKKLIFLHWYHHITVLLYCWHSYVTISPPGIFFCVMNYAVHALMYFYYFLMAVRLKPKCLPPMMITVAQISQMVVGVAVTLMAFYFYKTEPSCFVRAENNAAAFLMYGSYLALFLQFFIGRYIQPKVTIGSTKKQV